MDLMERHFSVHDGGEEACCAHLSLARSLTLTRLVRCGCGCGCGCGSTRPDDKPRCTGITPHRSDTAQHTTTQLLTSRAISTHSILTHVYVTTTTSHALHLPSLATTAFIWDWVFGVLIIFGVHLAVHFHLFGWQGNGVFMSFGFRT